LTQSGQSSITASNVTVVSSSKVTCTFDLNGKKIGLWNVLISSGSFSHTLSNAFEIKTGYSTSKTETIDPNEDTSIVFTAETGVVKVDVPAGTFDESVTMTVSVATVPESDDNTIMPTSVGIDISLSNSSLDPQKKITITLYYRDSDISGFNESQLAICFYNEDEEMWSPLPSTVYENSNYVTGRTTHLSLFAVAQLDAASHLHGARAYPNPFNPKRDSQGLTFSHLTDDATIKIFNIAGELVKTLKADDGTGREVWDGKNESGSDVASGVYIALIESPTGKKKIKIALQR